LSRAVGYEAACSAYGGYNLPGNDPFHLKRRCLDGSLLRIKNWVTIDPFRNRHVREFVDVPEPPITWQESVTRNTGLELAEVSRAACLSRATPSLEESDKEDLQQWRTGASRSINRQDWT
jgi:hypothetical protein